MRGSKRIASLFVCFTMLASVTAGCGGTDEEQKNNDSAKSEAPAQIVFMTPGDLASKPLSEDDRIITEINKKLGIKLKVNGVPEGQQGFEKVNIAMASGDVPDVVVNQYGSNAVSSWIKNDMLVPLNDYFKDAPNIKKIIDEKLTWSAIDGKYYGYVMQETKSNISLAYRADWMEKLGLKSPKTLDEFYQVLKAIATKDPDGNGKNDTYGITAEKPTSGNFANGALDFIFYAYGLPGGDWVLDSKGQVAPRFEHPAYKEGLKYIKKLWDENLLEHDFIMNDVQMREQKFYQGKVGFMVASLFRHVNRIESNLKKVSPQGMLGYMEPPAGPDGKRGLSAAQKGTLFTAVTKASKNPKKAVMFLDFLLSKEGRDLLQLGIEGVHYTKQNGKIVYNEQERAKDSFAPGGWSHPLAWGNVIWPLGAMYLPETEPQRERALESVELASKYVAPNLIPVKTDAEIKNGKVVNELYIQYTFDIISGKIDVDTGLAELSKKWKQQGGEEILKSLNEEYKKLKK